MVGVPGRSKGCLTCRRRKKGCDKNVPSCHQCIQSGLTCGGYGRDLIWVNTTPERDKGTQEKPHASRAGNSSSHRTPWSTIYTTKTGNGNADVALHASLVRSAREQLFFGMFLSAALPYGHLLSPQASRLSTNGWMAAVAEFYNNETTIRYASLAMSAGIIGVESQNSQLRVQGLQAYNTSVREMVRALKDPKRSKGDGIIAAARVMQIYEAFFGRSPDWRAHVEGQLALFLARGPEGFTSGQGHQLYVDGRILIVMLAIGRRVRSPLNTPEWRTIPWRLTPKSAKDKLVDVLENIPDMLIKYDDLRACASPNHVQELRSIVLLSCEEIEAGLTAWEKEAGVHLEKFDYSIAGSPLPMPQDDREFALLHISSIYWGARLVLYTTVGLAMSFVFQDDKQESATPAARPPIKSLFNSDQSISVNPRIYACKIAHLIHLFFEPTAGFVQGASAFFPMALALRFFATTEPAGQRSEESQMMFDLFNRPFMGTFVGRFLTDLQGGTTESPEAKRVRDTRAQQNIWWYEVLGRESISRGRSP